MSEECHVCGPVKHEAPTVICAPCARTPSTARCSKCGSRLVVTDRDADAVPPGQLFCDGRCEVDLEL